MNKNMKNTEEINTHHIDVLDGIRSLAVIIVVWFHFWQQSWVSPSIQTPYLSFFNIHYISLDWLPRTGYIMVVMMLFLSGFCLYLPYARHIINGEPLPSTKSFFKKRVARILPSYIFCIITILLINIFTCAYTSPSFPLRDQSGFMLKDVLTHLTFSFNLFPDVSSNTLLNGVLWTVALEVQFYILFPWIQKCFQHKPVLTYCIMNAISYTFILYSTKQTNVSFLMHQLPSYFGVYANGFMGAMIFVGIAKHIKRNKYVGLFSTIISLMSIFVYYQTMKVLCETEDLTSWQLNNRFILSILFLVFCISTALASKWYRVLYANRFATFLSTISFNLYIWHQYISVQLKNNHIPYYVGDEAPNLTGDQVWMRKYLIICCVFSIIVACLTTYLLEKPFSNLILGRKSKTGQSDK